MKRYVLLILVINLFLGLDAQILELKNSETTFYSYTIVENIDANTKDAQGLIDLKTKEFYFEIPVNTFDFEKDLMEEHFNENYLETEDYPKATFEGYTKTEIDLEKTGVYVFSGDLYIHGKTKKREIEVTIKRDSNGELILESKFKVKLKDHKIKVPKIVFANIAEIIDVTIDGKLIPIKE